ncbi:hypothetical protein QQ045_015340 [Rhodiola kirilowii]
MPWVSKFVERYPRRTQIVVEPNRTKSKYPVTWVPHGDVSIAYPSRIRTDTDTGTGDGSRVKYPCFIAENHIDYHNRTSNNNKRWRRKKSEEYRKSEHKCRVYTQLSVLSEKNTTRGKCCK